ncbi:MAG: hypothetical protein U0904_11860, partial [Candidatus Nanopelagicales bacterium]|nr:hypothetical protein [Candidatus Nanopelagicales bacterium]
VSLYRYVGNSPLARTDASGLEVEQNRVPNAGALVSRCVPPCGLGAAGSWLSERFGDGLLGRVDQEVSLLPFDPGLLDKLPKKGDEGDDKWADYPVGTGEGKEGLDMSKEYINPTTRAGTALRHCVTAGYLARAAGCACAECCGTFREEWQRDNERQSPYDSNKGVYNNAHGLRCAKCSGEQATNDPVDVVCASEGVTVLIWKYPSEGDIMACCKEKLLNGTLHITGDFPEDWERQF